MDILMISARIKTREIGGATCKGSISSFCYIYASFLIQFCYIYSKHPVTLHILFISILFHFSEIIHTNYNWSWSTQGKKNDKTRRENLVFNLWHLNIRIIRGKFSCLKNVLKMNKISQIIQVHMDLVHESTTRKKLA